MNEELVNVSNEGTSYVAEVGDWKDEEYLLKTQNREKMEERKLRGIVQNSMILPRNIRDGKVTPWRIRQVPPGSDALGIEAEWSRPRA